MLTGCGSSFLRDLDPHPIETVQSRAERETVRAAQQGSALGYSPLSGQSPPPQEVAEPASRPVGPSAFDILARSLGPLGEHAVPNSEFLPLVKTACASAPRRGLHQLQ